ncbi:dTDP-4-dehydrorhamnose reductase [Shewanella pealeana]|uniref:dTDP-4-dehydrorhamnose reductase n=1 Tax=Shewanella pealeana (strain ATCC 700345 / ANG-SQ1) TaxID=398579 RepID=A8H2H5_SHEPA|nr:dTDP-4-dehydrorhamnose reductase [Shewanella pealeana]ABV86762.1 dTDP-4-dehydrorhamnose reductase [Shewanella pealeana ATCC 700345]
MRILITGAAGQLGQALLSIAGLTQVNLAERTVAQQMLVALLPEALECIETTDEVIGVSHQALDICDIDSIRKAFDTIAPDVVINCAAYNAVDKAEFDIDKAMLINAEGPKLLAGECQRHNIRLVHISTDFVFDGELLRAYTEQDSPAPLSVYGKSKLEGERWVSDILGSKATIIRTSWLYSCYGHNFVKTMQSLFKVKESLSVINDQYGSPTWCEALAVAIFMLVKQTQATILTRPSVCEDKPAKGLADLYHYAASASASWYEFACEIQRQAGSVTELAPSTKLSQNKEFAPNSADCSILPITTKAWQELHDNRLALRPKQSALNTQKLCHQLAIEPGSLLTATWQQQLAAMVSYQKVKSRES